MRPHPAYYLIKKDIKDIQQQPAQQDQKCPQLFSNVELRQTKGESPKNYALIPVKVPAPFPEEYLLELDGECKKIHVSVYENFSDAWDGMSAYHVTFEYRDKENKETIVHSYFNLHGDYLNCQAQGGIELSAADQTTIQRFSAEIMSAKIERIFFTLQGELTQIKTKKDQALLALEEESKKGTISQSYYQLLTDIIPILRDGAELSSDPKEDLALINLFTRAQQDIGQKLPKPKSKKKSNKKAAQPQEEKVEVLDISTAFQETIEQSPAVKSKITACRVDNVSSIIALTKELAKFDKQRQQELYTACQIGDFKLVQKNFNQNRDYLLTSALLLTSLYYGHSNIIDFLSKQDKRVFARGNFFYEMQGLSFIKEITFIAGPLSIAFHKKDLELFKKLLTIYGFSPIEINYSTQRTLAHQILLSDNKAEEANLPYLKALLEAKLDPNKKIITKMLVIDKAVGVSSKNISQSLLCVAAELGRPKAVRLLVEYKAKTEVSEEQDCPFRAAIYADNPHPEVINFFLQRGKKIDQPYTSPAGRKRTALYRAASVGNASAVKVLLDSKANPCEPHQNFLFLSQKSVNMTPFTIAAKKEHMPVVKMFLDYGISSKEVLRLLLLQQNIPTFLPKHIEDKLKFVHLRLCLEEIDQADQKEDFAKVAKLSEWTCQFHKGLLSEKNIAAAQTCVAVQYKMMRAWYHLNELSQLAKVTEDKHFMRNIKKVETDPIKVRLWEKLFILCKQKLAEVNEAKLSVQK